MSRILTASLSAAAIFLLSSSANFAQAAPHLARSAPAASGDAALEAAWQKYYVTLKKVHDDILNSEQYKRFKGQRSMAYYSLLEAQAIAYNFAMAPQLASPRIYRATSWQTEMYTLGGNSADFQYGTVFLDGKLTYRLTGKMNDSAVLLAQWSGSLPGTNAYTPPISYDFSRFKTGKDGSFEVTLSAKPVKGNWIKLDPNARYQWILFRPMTGKWDAKPAELKIERVSDVDLNAYRAREISPETVADRIDFAADFVRFMVDQWNIDYYRRMRANAGGVNKLNTLALNVAGDVGSPAAQYLQGVYNVNDDEALIVEMDGPPGGAFWTIQLFDSWLKSIDFRTRQSSLSMDQAVRDADGKYRFVISRRDPGVANWLDTGGVEDGMLLIRNYRTQQMAKPPTITRVKFAQLANYLPKDTAKVSPTQRAEDIRKRDEAHLRRLKE